MSEDYAPIAIADQAPPDPGYYPDTPDPDYRAWNALNSSFVKEVAMRTPSHAKYGLDNPKQQTDEMKLGTALHVKTLKPDEYERDWKVASPCQATIGSGARKGHQCGNDTAKPYGLAGDEITWLCGTHAKKCGAPLEGNFISQTDHHRVLAMESRLNTHAKTRAFFNTVVHRELAGVWTDPGSGMPCKLLADMVCEVPNGKGGHIRIAADLKTTQDASPEAFSRRIFDLGYHIQAKHYMDGLDAVDLPVDHFVFIAIESSAPFEPAVYEIDQAALDAAERLIYGPEIERNRGAYAVIAKCFARGLWPGYTTRLTPIGLPGFGVQRVDAQVDRLTALATPSK